jgi:hypothetical protein
VVIDELVSIIPLGAGAESWGREAIRRLQTQHPSRADSLARVESSPFSLAAGTDNIMALYADL